jgi:hypothetical protein
MQAEGEIRKLINERSWDEIAQVIFFQYENAFS